MPEGLTIQQILWYAAIVILSISLVRSTIKVFTIGQARTDVLDAVATVSVTCASCGWNGEVPRLNRRCPMCGDSNFT